MTTYLVLTFTSSPIVV